MEPDHAGGLVGRQIERYRIEGVLGTGGFGTAYRARHTVLDRAVALKVLHSDRMAPETLQRLFREARVTSALESEHIVKVFDCGVAESGHAFIALELLDGEDLATRLERTGALSPGDAAAVALELLRALSASHAAGIVHRDLKPSNVFLVRTSRGHTVKLLDFGVSLLRGEALRLTASGAVMGTPQYMAPEQLRSARGVDARTDLYAVGVVLYEMLSGCLPYDADSYEALVLQVASEPIRPLRQVAPHVPESLARVVERALAKDPDARFDNAGELADAPNPRCRC